MTNDQIICKALWHIAKALSSQIYGNNPGYSYSQCKIAMDVLEAHIGPQHQTFNPRNPPDDKQTPNWKQAANGKPDF